MDIGLLTKYQLNISIISAYGNTVIPKEIYEYENLKIILLPRLNKDQFLNCLLNSKLVISIPESDSSPRSVYESIALGCKIFVSNISCFDWLPKELRSEFIFSSSSVYQDSENLLMAIDHFSEKNFNDLKVSYPDFFNKLDYKNIARSYLEVFTMVKFNYIK